MKTSNGKSTSVQIVFPSGGFLLSGILHLPETKTPPIVIGAHGLLANKDSPKQIALAQKCNEMGIAYFRFDFRGCGQSQGNFSKDTTFEARCEDLKYAIENILDRNDIGDRLGLFGSSLGGSVSIATASVIPIYALVTFASPIRSKGLSIPCGAMPDQLRTNRQLQFDISDRLSSIHNILIIHGEKDPVVPLAHSKEIYDRVRGSKSLIIQKGGDHAMSNTSHQKDFIAQTSLWFHERLKQ